MIQSRTIKMYIINSFVEHCSLNINKISNIIYNSIYNRFLVNEIVIFKNERLEGRIALYKDKKYSVVISSKKIVYVNVGPQYLYRKYTITNHLILDFLLRVTCDSPFGYKILKPEVFKEVYFKTNVVINNMAFEYYTPSTYKRELKNKNEKENNVEVKKNSQPSNEIKKNQDVLDFSKSEIFEISDFKYAQLSKILKIYTFITNFCSDKIFNNLTISRLIKYLRDPTYNSDIVSSLHVILIDNLTAECQSIGINNLLTNIRSVVDSLPDERIPKEEIKKKNDVGLKAWKIKCKNFLWDIFEKTKNDTIYLFINCITKKKMIDIYDRIELLEFLISCYFATNIFRDIILNEIKDIKELEKSSAEIEQIIAKKENKNYTCDKCSTSGCTQCLNEETLKQKEEFKEINTKILLSPTRTEIGSLNNVKFILVNKIVYVNKNSVFYIANRDTLEGIIKNYKPLDKLEVITINNIKNIVRFLY